MQKRMKNWRKNYSNHRSDYMKFKAAKELGVALGLKTPSEWIWNFINHASQLCLYPEIAQEIEELLQDAQASGIDLVAIGVLKKKEE